MKPIILVDKSFIQSLSVKEADTLKTHFRILITPILVQEMITDIEKYKEDFDGTLERLRILADKVGSGGQYSVPDARILFHANLEGCKFGSDFRIPVFNPKQVKALDGSIGCIIEESFEQKLIRKWQKKEVSDKDIQAAKNYYKDFVDYYSVNRNLELADEFPMNKRFTILADFVAWIDTTELPSIKGPMYFESASKRTQTPSEVIAYAKLQWERNGKSHFESLYTYAFYFTRLNVIYSLGLPNDVIPASRHSNAVIDI